MKKKSLYLFTITLFIGYLSFSQNISGSWSWVHSKNHASEINLSVLNVNQYKGNYCSSFYKGKKIDCYLLDESTSIIVTKKKANIFIGTFKSNFSNTSGTIRLEYYPKKKQLKLTILSEPKGEFYLPNNVFFNKQ